MERSLKLLTGWGLALLVATLAQVQEVRSSPLGAPACEHMALRRSDLAPHTSVPPYLLQVSGGAVVGGETVGIVLSSEPGEAFDGFFIQARDVDTEEIIGTFQTDEWKYVDCESGIENAVTHSDLSTKTSVTVDWVAPADYDGVVVFRATVVRQLGAVRVGVESPEVAVTPARSLLDFPAPKSMRDAYDGCGVTKGCFGIMENCIDTADCMVVITYAKAGDNYAMEVFGAAADDSTDVYMAGGLSFDTEMANTSVMACRSFGGVVDVVMAFNSAGHSNDILPIPDMGLSDIVVSHADGILYCSFTREAVLVVGGFTYDMNSDMYYLEVAHGNLSDTGALTKHKHEGVAEEGVSLGDFPPASASP